MFLSFVYRTAQFSVIADIAAKIEFKYIPRNFLYFSNPKHQKQSLKSHNS